ncbi:MAG: efflux RND transporter periplasmic adaptor subunit [Deltaproteobacteria bacterium]|jgi:membrane fusion protein (multidrug efflux system)|nr:efflux RND transporter periplasmic adaptor subunit [Deltaproteobacteria bacterium]
MNDSSQNPPPSSLKEPDKVNQEASLDKDSQAHSGTKALVKTISILLFLALLGSLYWFFFLRPYQSTDDAYVSGNQVRINAKTSGLVTEVLVDDTETVKAGQTLVLLDDKEAALAVQKSISLLELAALEIASLKAKSEQLKAQLEVAQRQLTLAQDEYDRRRKLKPGASITAEEIQRHKLQALAAQASLEAAKRELEATVAQLGSGPLSKHPRINQALAQLREDWLSLKRCRVVSPVAGQVGRRTVQVGSKVTDSTPLMVVVPLEEVWVEANFKEDQLTYIKPGHRAQITADFYGSKVKYQGSVVGFSPGTGGVFSLLPPENATGNWIKVVQRVPVKIIIDSNDLIKAPLLLGLSLKVKIKVSQDPHSSPSLTRGFGYSALKEDYGEVELEALAASIIALSLSKMESAANDLRPDNSLNFETGGLP